MITRHHFHYINADGVWKSACSFKGYRRHDGEWRNEDAGEFYSEETIRRCYKLGVPHLVDCKTCLKNQKLKKLLQELSPWPHSILKNG